MKISFRSRGSTAKTERFLKKMQSFEVTSVLASAGEKGVRALEAATPRDSGLAAGSWSYSIRKSAKDVRIVWTNNDVESGFPVAIMLQYGYSTGTGGYVQGRDYINPAMRPLFDQIANDVWKAVTNA